MAAASGPEIGQGMSSGGSKSSCSKAWSWLESSPRSPENSRTSLGNWPLGPWFLGPQGGQGNAGRRSNPQWQSGVARRTGRAALASAAGFQTLFWSTLVLERGRSWLYWLGLDVVEGCCKLAGTGNLGEVKPDRDSFADFVRGEVTVLQREHPVGSSESWSLRSPPG